MSRLPVVATAHWFTMISFGVLFLTLVTAFGQLADPTFALPLLGHWVVYEWVTELFAWTGLVGIVALMVVRQRQHPRNSPARAAAARASSARRPGRPTTSS